MAIRPTTAPQPPPPSQRQSAAMSYLRTSVQEGAFTGGDGTYSIPLGPDRTAWVCGDTFVGGVQPDGSRSHDQGTFVRNSLVLQERESLRLANTVGDAGAVDLARPPGMRTNRDGSLPDEWYWPGHGTSDGEHLSVFMQRFRTEPGAQTSVGWNWQFRGTDLAQIDARTGALLTTTRLFDGGDTHWGSAVLERGPHTYIYGARAGEAMLARTLRGELAVRDAWEFWDGSTWTPDLRRAAPLDGPKVSNQFGVVDARDGGVLLLSQVEFEQGVRAWHAPAPGGHYRGGDIAMEIPVQPNERRVYNAVPHPQFGTGNGDVLVSYNVGGGDFMADHTSYRPGFLTIPAERLPGGGAAAHPLRMGDHAPVS